MARETKLGLLVGLGFIICFAIILENRGRRDQVTPQMPHELLAQSSGGSDQASPTLAQQRAREYGRPAAGPSRETGQPAAERQSTARRGRGRAQPTADEATHGPVTEPAEVDRSQAAGEGGSADRFTRRRDVTLASSTDGPADEPQSGTEAAGVQQASLTATSPLSRSQPEPSSITTTPRAAKSDVRYEVQTGDSLSRIAARHYGSRSKSVIDAVFDANRATMSSPDALKVGQVILLPEIEGVSRQSSSPPAQADTGRDAPAATPAPPTEYRPYQVRKGDRYITIAKEQLGDGSRWREIAELNRDVFPDPAKIRYGVRIRLPVDSKSKQTGQQS